MHFWQQNPVKSENILPEGGAVIASFALFSLYSQIGYKSMNRTEPNFIYTFWLWRTGPS